MRFAFSFFLLAFLSGCGQAKPSRVMSDGAFNSIATEAETERRAQERLNAFAERRELNWDQPITVETSYAPLTELGEEVDPRGRGPGSLSNQATLRGSDIAQGTD